MPNVGFILVYVENVRRSKSEHDASVLGLALGAVFVPCAGPVLAAITVAGATGDIGVDTIALSGGVLPRAGLAEAGNAPVARERGRAATEPSTSASVRK